MSMTGRRMTRTGVRLDARARMRHILALNKAGMEHSELAVSVSRTLFREPGISNTSRQLDINFTSGAFHQPCDRGGVLMPDAAVRQ